MKVRTKHSYTFKHAPTEDDVQRCCNDAMPGMLWFSVYHGGTSMLPAAKAFEVAHNFNRLSGLGHFPHHRAAITITVGKKVVTITTEGSRECF